MTTKKTKVSFTKEQWLGFNARLAAIRIRQAAYDAKPTVDRKADAVEREALWSQLNALEKDVKLARAVAYFHATPPTGRPS